MKFYFLGGEEHEPLGNNKNVVKTCLFSVFFYVPEKQSRVEINNSTTVCSEVLIQVVPIVYDLLENRTDII